MTETDQEAHRAALLRHGQLCYLQIPATDTTVSAEFYTALFGWHTSPPDPGFDAPDLIGQWVTDRPVAADEGPLGWINVTDIDQVLVRAGQLGGTVVEPVSIDGGVRRLATIRDPAGNTIGLAQHGTGAPVPEADLARTPGEGPGTDIRADPRVSRPGGLSYLHIPAVDVRRAALFYEAAFGWQVSGHDTDRPSFEDGTGHVAGAWMRTQAISREPGLLPFIFVTDIDDAAARVTRHGGQILTPPYAQGSLRVATFRDPEGNVMGIWQETAP